MNADNLQTVWAPRALSILRIVAALIFMEHGTQKLFGFPPSDNPGPALFSLLGLAGVLEVVGGILLLLGLFTRPVAFILSGQMAVAYWMAHAPQSFFPPSTAATLRSSTASCSCTWSSPAVAPGAWTTPCGAGPGPRPCETPPVLEVRFGPGEAPGELRLGGIAPAMVRDRLDLDGGAALWIWAGLGVAAVVAIVVAADAICIGINTTCSKNNDDNDDKDQGTNEPAPQ